MRWPRRTMRRLREEAQADGAGEEGSGHEEVPPPMASAAAAAPARPTTTAAPTTPARASGSKSPAAAPAAPAPAASTSSSSECPHAGLSRRSNFLAAQNTWDACMAHSIRGALHRLPPGGVVLHVAGKAHVEMRLGIVEHLLAEEGTGRKPADEGARGAASAGAGAAASGAGVSEGGEGTREAGARLSAPDEAGTSTGAAGQGAAGAAHGLRVGVVVCLPSQRGVALPAELLRGARLHTLGDWVVLTDGRRERSFDVTHPV
jgi:hypothetical protein